MTETASKSANRPTPLPTNKVIAGGAVGALVTIGVFIMNTYFLKDNKIPAEVASALTTILGAVASYYTSPSSDQTTV
jgi:hypothetical protein